MQRSVSRQSPRNRRIADIFLKCGLVERSGQGMNLMFEDAIRESKPLPDFTNTDRHQVSVTLQGTMRNPDFIRFLEKIGNERTENLSTDDWMLLGCVARGEKPPEVYKPRIDHLLELGIIERAGRGKLILSHKYYSFIGRKGAYTRKKGLDRETNKSLLLKHIEENMAEGSPLQDLMDVLPALTRNQVQTLLRELKSEGRIHPVGATRAGRWHPGSGEH